MVSVDSSWSPTQTIGSTLLSIRSLMTEHPYYNQPGFERDSKDYSVSKYAKNYDQYIQDETLRVAVIEMLKDDGVDSYEMPAALKEVMISHFKTHMTNYEKLIDSIGYDGMPVKDPSYGSVSCPTNFQYKELWTEILALQEKFGNAKDISTPIYNKMITTTFSLDYMDHVANSLEDETEDEAEYEEDVDVVLYEEESDSESVRLEFEQVKL